MVTAIKYSVLDWVKPIICIFLTSGHSDAQGERHSECPDVKNYK